MRLHLERFEAYICLFVFPFFEVDCAYDIKINKNSTWRHVQNCYKNGINQAVQIKNLNSETEWQVHACF